MRRAAHNKSKNLWFFSTRRRRSSAQTMFVSFVSLSFSVRTTSVVERCRHRWMKLQERSRGTEQWRWWLETSPQQQQHHKATLEVVECLIRLSQSSQTCYVNAASHRLKWKSISSSLVLSLEMNNSEFDMCVVLSHQSPNISIYRHSISIWYPKNKEKSHTHPL